jgi:hypothetical protein
MVGYAVDILAFAGAFGGGMWAVIQPGFFGSIIALAGVCALPVGSLIISSAATYRYGRFRHFGYNPINTPLGGSWTATSIVAALSGVSIGFAAAARKVPCCNTALEQKYFRVSAAVGIGAVAVEFISLIAIHGNTMPETLKKAPRTVQSPRPMVYPTVYPAPNPVTGKTTLAVGLSGVF